MSEHFLEKAKQISELYIEIGHSRNVLKRLMADKWFSVSGGGSSSYVVSDPSVVDITIQALREKLEQKEDQLNELINGEYNKVMSNLSIILHDKEK